MFDDACYGWGVTYFCFIENSILGVPHMEPLSADTDEAAIAEAEILLDQHASGYAAHILNGETRVHTIRREPATPAPLPASADVSAASAPPSSTRSGFP